MATKRTIHLHELMKSDDDWWPFGERLDRLGSAGTARSSSSKSSNMFSYFAKMIFFCRPCIMVSKGNHPQMAARFRLMNYYNLPRCIIWHVFFRSFYIVTQHETWNAAEVWRRWRFTWWCVRSLPVAALSPGCSLDRNFKGWQTR